MMNIIAVDDEQHALRTIAKVTKNVMPGMEPVLFGKAEEALDYAKNNRVDVALLDVDMSSMNGLILAKHLKDIYSKTNIIFVTGYSQYAVSALNLYPSGYLLKPVTEENMREAMENLRHPVASPTDKRLRIQCFGNFEAFVDGKPLRFSRAKSKELFAYLIHKNGAACTIREVAAVLFEDNKETNVRPYISALIRTLKEAGMEGVIIKDFNSIAVDVSKVDCDLYRFRKMEASAVNEYTGEYMAQYSWGEFMMGYLEERAMT